MNDEDARLLAEIRKVGPLKGYPTKICPFCIQPIPLDATVCKFCTRTVNTEEEVTDLLRAYFKKVLEERRRQKHYALAHWCRRCSYDHLFGQ